MLKATMFNFKQLVCGLFIAKQVALMCRVHRSFHLSLLSSGIRHCSLALPAETDKIKQCDYKDKVSKREVML